MTIKNYGGIFGRNPKFNSVEADSITVAGETIPDLTTVLVDGDIGSTVQGYDADTAKYDDATANFTGTLQNGGSNVLVDTDIGSTVQGFDADTAKLDAIQTFTAAQTFEGDVLGKEIMTGTDANASFTITVTGALGIGSGDTRATKRLNLISVFTETSGHICRGYALYTSQYNGNAVLIATLGTSVIGGTITFGVSGSNPTIAVTNSAGGTVNYTVNAVPLI